MVYAQLLSLGLGFLGQFLDSLTKNNAPAEVIASVQAAIAAIQTHHDDILSKANFEAQRA